MKAGHKFLLGAAVIVGSIGFFIAEGVKQTGVYFLTPAELSAKTGADTTFVENVGFKYHGNSIMAAIGLVSLKYLEADNGYRRQLADWYDAGLSGAPAIKRVPMAAACVPARHLYQVMVERRDEVMTALNAAQIYPGVHYRDNSYYRMYADQPPCPRARQASDSVISLPMHLNVQRQDVERTCEALRGVTGA